MKVYTLCVDVLVWLWPSWLWLDPFKLCTWAWDQFCNISSKSTVKINIGRLWLALCTSLITETSCPSPLCHLQSYHHSSFYFITMFTSTYWWFAPFYCSYLYNDLHRKVRVRSPTRDIALCLFLQVVFSLRQAGWSAYFWQCSCSHARPEWSQNRGCLMWLYRCGLQTWLCSICEPLTPSPEYCHCNWDEIIFRRSSSFVVSNKWLIHSISIHDRKSRGSLWSLIQKCLPNLIFLMYKTIKMIVRSQFSCREVLAGWLTYAGWTNNTTLVLNKTCIRLL